jgi:DHA1 family tetracycline resistance protein-like MFS transporter
LERKSAALWVTYLLAALGDLNNASIAIASILYGVILGATPFQNGLIGAAYGFSYIIMAALLGRLGDKITRKYSLILSSTAFVIISMYYVFLVTSVVQLIVCQFIMGCINGSYYPSIEAYVSENSDYSFEKHQKALSSYCISWSIGYMLGPFLAGIFSDFNVRVVFLVALLSYVIVLLSVVIFLPNIKMYKKNDTTEFIKNRTEQKPFKSNLETKNDPNSRNLMIRVLFGILVYGILSRVALTYFSDFASRPDGLDFSGIIIGTIFFAFGAGRTLYFIVSRYLKSSMKFVSYSFLIVSLLFLTLIFMGNAIIIGIIYFLAGIFCGLIYKTSLELLIREEFQAKGAKTGIFESVVGIGSAFSLIMAGLLAEIFPTLPFIVFALMFLIFFLVNQYLGR